MSLWGNKDSKSASGTIQSVDADGNVVGSGTAFTTQAKVGNTIYTDGREYVILTIQDNTHCVVRSGVQGGIIDVGSSYSYTLSEKPAFVSTSESGDTSGDSGDSSKVYGVDTAEIYAGAGQITDVAIIQGGSNYTEVPNVNIVSGDGGQAQATATIADGVVTAITVTDTGGWSYQDLPNVYIDIPARTFATGDVNTTAETISYEAHGLNTGDAMTYYGSGLSVSCQDEDTVYVIKINNDTFKLAASLINAEAGTAMNLTSTGSNGQRFDLQAPAGVTATAKAVKGSGSEGDNAQGYAEWSNNEQHVTHAGWVRKTVGYGGRAGRVQYETLVAMSSIQGDQADDIAFGDD